MILNDEKKVIKKETVDNLIFQKVLSEEVFDP